MGWRIKLPRKFLDTNKPPDHQKSSFPGRASRPLLVYFLGWGKPPEHYWQTVIIRLSILLHKGPESDKMCRLHFLIVSV